MQLDTEAYSIKPFTCGSFRFYIIKEGGYFKIFTAQGGCIRKWGLTHFTKSTLGWGLIRRWVSSKGGGGAYEDLRYQYRIKDEHLSCQLQCLSVIC